MAALKVSGCHVG